MFPSKNQASKNATMIGAYDSSIGKTAIGNSNANITEDSLHPTTVNYIEKQLGVKIGELQVFVKTRLGHVQKYQQRISLLGRVPIPQKLSLPKH